MSTINSRRKEGYMLTVVFVRLWYSDAAVTSKGCRVPPKSDNAFYENMKSYFCPVNEYRNAHC